MSGTCRSLLCWLLSLPPQTTRGDFREIPTPLVVEKLPQNRRAQFVRFWPMIMEFPSTTMAANSDDVVHNQDYADGKSSDGTLLVANAAAQDRRMVQSMISQVSACC